MVETSLVIVGNPEPFHIGAHLKRAAQALGVPVELADTRQAFAGSWLVRQLNWRLRGHRPPRLGCFGRSVLDLCRQVRPTHVLATGHAPLDAAVLRTLVGQGIVCSNYLTDDPWNPAHRAPWLLAALPHYSQVFTPRRANVYDLEGLSGPVVRYVPFAYDPTLHFREPPATGEEWRSLECDVLFFGGADADRLPYITALLQAGLDVHLYGGYWRRFSATRGRARGHADAVTLRHACAAARITLCMVRRANRDGHVMRTFEAPAMGACLLAEDTAEHREILGDDRQAVVYFRTTEEMVAGARWLLQHPDERQKLAALVHERVTRQPNTYQDRLRDMLSDTS